MYPRIPHFTVLPSRPYFKNLSSSFSGIGCCHGLRLIYNGPVRLYEQYIARGMDHEAAYRLLVARVGEPFIL